MDSQKQDLKTTKPSDAESLLASALLEIRSDARREAAAAAAAQQQQQRVSASPSLPPAQPPAVIQRPLRKPKVPNPIAPNVQPVVAAPTLPYSAATAANMGAFSAEQITALRVAAAASAASFAAASPFNQLNLIQQSALSGQSVPVIQPQPTAGRAMAPTSTPQGLSAAPKPGAAAAAASAVSSGGATDCPIRRDQVQAALRSKPQRGRKREDLSELERLELTRTRNREHAKSTRVRKKARHQELLDTEKRFEELEKQLVLREKRCSVIAHFVRAREVMLHNYQASDSSHSSGENTAPTSNKVAGVPSWEELVESAAQFEFDEGWHKNENPRLSNVERMKQFDTYVHSSVTSKFGSTMIRMLRYNIKGGTEGIALDSANGGFAEVEIAMALPTSITLMTGMVRFRFGPDSEKLRSVAYVHAMDFLASSSERLDAQVSYPSTVSLDPPTFGGSDHHHHGGTGGGKPEAKHDESGGPGMNI